MAEARPCVNHPRETTRVACSTCGDPICHRCLHTAPVGQRCPRCAAPARGSRLPGKPVHYLRAVGAGLGAAVLGGIVLAQFVATIRFGALILSGVLGFLVGRAVGWGAHRQSQQPFPAIAIGCAVLGVALAMLVLTGFRTPVPPGGLLLLAYPIAGFLALRGIQ